MAGKKRVLLDERGDAGDRAVDLLGRACRSPAAIACRRSAARREHLAQQRAVEALLALEVVVEHRLVHPGAAGDAVDAGAGEAALGEFEGGGGEDAVGRDAGRATHMAETYKLTS